MSVKGYLIGMTLWVLLWIWAVFYLLCVAFPDGWIYEWYGWPTLVTLIAALIGGIVVPMAD